MTKKRLLITRRFPEGVLARADESYDCRWNDEDIPWSCEQLLKYAEDMDAILCSSSNIFSSEVIANLPKSVRIIATFSAGHEHIDLYSAKDLGITITNTPDVVTDSTADITILLLLAATRRAREAQQLIIDGKWDGWAPTQLLGIEPKGRCLGILGMGRIGSAVAHRARSFGLKIHYHNRNRLPREKERGAVFHETFESLLRVSDFLSINSTLNNATTKIINNSTINLLPKNAIIINTSRGAAIDDSALIIALKSGRVAAAGLDVFENEPNINKEYLSLPNAFLLPHIGSATTDARNSMGFRALDNIDEFFQGAIPKDKLV